MTTHPEIIVFSDEFNERDEYLAGIKKFIEENSQKQQCIVFLDPDTGLEPYGRPNHNHVLKKELREIWATLPSKWILAFYQHKTNRKGEE